MDTNGTTSTNSTLYGVGLEPQRWGWWIQHTVTPMIVVAGVVGNILSFIVMKSKVLRKKSYSHLLCTLAVFDSLCLINRQITLIHEILTEKHNDGVFKHFSDVSCQLFNFYEHMCYLMSSWLIVCMAFERVLAMCLPFKRTIMRTQTGALVMILSTLGFLFLTQVFRFVMVKNIGGLCLGDIYSHPEYIRLHIYFYQLTLVLSLPFVSITVCNCLVIYQIYRVRKAAVDCSSRMSSRMIQRSSKTTWMLLAISFTYLVTMLPLVVISFVWQVAMETANIKLALKLIPVQQFVSVFSYCNYASNFIIYILSGRAFRHELKKLFWRERPGSISNSRTKEEFLKLQ